jgi:hypothetical protein
MSGEGQGSTPEGFMKDAFRFCWDQLTNCLRTQEMFPAALDQASDSLKVSPGFFTIRSDKDTSWTVGLAQNAFLACAGNGLTGLASNKIIIRRVKCQSDQNLDWDWFFWKTDGMEDTDLDLDSFCGEVYMDSISGSQLAGANQYYYDTDEIYLPFEDLDGTFELHSTLCNRSAVSKIAGATGEIILEVEYAVAW